MVFGIQVSQSPSVDAFRYPEILRRLRNIISRPELERAFRRAKAGKMRGHDLIPDELFANFPSLFADPLHPIVVRTGLLISEPISVKGGTMCEIYKAALSGAHDICSSFRGVWVNSGFAKHTHRAYRSRLTHVAQAQPACAS